MTEPDHFSEGERLAELAAAEDAPEWVMARAALANAHFTAAQAAALSEQTAAARAEVRRQVAEEIAAEIERVVVSGDFPRPGYERGGFLNDARWAAQIARTIGGTQ